jgi:CTP:molybdopterin cytidylyltransferase MocA
VRIAAVVLAAGEGRRMAQGPKALLPLQGTTFLSRCLERLSVPAVEAIVVVLGHEAERVRERCPLGAHARFVVNPRWPEGMLSSVLAGLAAAEEDGAEAVLVHPVDSPAVEAATVRRVVAALEGGARVAVPSLEGRRGHPVGFAREAWPALRAAPPERGMRAVLHDHPDWVTHVAGDPGCLVDVDSPSDWGRLPGR